MVQASWKEKFPTDDDAVDELLSRPTPGVLETVARLPGDYMVLGVGGKMGPTLAQMLRRALDAQGLKAKVYGVARFSSEAAQGKLQKSGIETVRCDLLQPETLTTLPDAPNIIFMAGFKFGASAAPDLTWAMNGLVPAYVAERFASSRIVAFSTGCVYPFVPVLEAGSREEDTLAPLGEYANSCVARERVFTYFSRKNGTPVALFRLNYAIDLRYGVLVDVAQKVLAGAPIDLTMGHANMIWQGDANAQAIQCLEHAASPPFALNVTGPETVSIRAVARRFGQILGIEPILVGQEAPNALLSNAGKAQQLFGYPTVPLDETIEMTARWLRQGGATLNKPTHFEVRDGTY